MIKQPQGQKRLTNVAIVKYKCKGKRFEVAAYKNKVLNFREGIEKDINEVLQIVTVFTNVSKGDVANDQDLKKAFGTIDQEDVCRKILKSGDLQVSDLEREVNLEGLFRDIVQIVVERCVHPQTGRQLTATIVENALKAIGFSVKSDHVAKKQALKAIESLCAEIPDSFARAKMRLRITCPEGLREEVRTYLKTRAGAELEDETASEGGGVAFTFLCPPSQYRELDGFATVTHAGVGIAMQVITATVLGEASKAAASEPAATPAVAAVPAASSQFAPPARPSIATPAAAASGGQQEAASEAQPQSKKAFKCSACAAEFEDTKEYRQHCRSDWHNFNLKRKVKALATVSEEEFIEISLDAKEGFLAVDA